MKTKEIIKLYFAPYGKLIATLLLFLFLSIMTVKGLNSTLTFRINWWVDSNKLLPSSLALTLMAFPIWVLMNTFEGILSISRKKRVLINSLGGTDLAIKKAEVYVLFMWSLTIYLVSYILPIFLCKFTLKTFSLPSAFYFALIFIIIFTISILMFKKSLSGFKRLLVYASPLLFLFIDVIVTHLNRSYYISTIDNISTSSIDSKLIFIDNIFTFINSYQVVLIILITIPFLLYIYKFFNYFIKGDVGGYL